MSKSGFGIKGFSFKKVVFFGRSCKEVCQMFLIGDDYKSLQSPIRVLDCPGGPSSFAADAAKYGCNVTAIDPIYSLSPQKVEEQALQDLEHVTKKLSEDKMIAEVGEFLDRKRSSMELFFTDFKKDREQDGSRYISASLPDLPFQDNEFDVTLSGTLLFVYSPVSAGGLSEDSTINFDIQWHRKAIFELLRVTRKELRIYPAHTWNQTIATRHLYAEQIAEELSSDARFEVEWYESNLPAQGQEGTLEGLIIRKM